ncbi:MAG: efflux RND transporter permease subunit [Thermotogota bacterium]
MKKNNSIFFIISVLTITVFMIISLSDIQVSEDMSAYIGDEEEIIQQYNNVNEKFGMGEKLLISFTFDNLYENIHNIEKITQNLSNKDYVKKVTSLTNTLSLRPGSLGSVGTINDFFDISKKSNYSKDEIKEFIENNKMLQETYVSDDFNSVLFVLDLKDNYDPNIIGDLYDSLNSEYENEVYISGMPFINYELAQTAMKDMIILLPIAVLVILLILFMFFRSKSGIFLPISTVIIGAIWIMGVMNFTYDAFTSITLIIPIILIGIGVDYSIHFLSRYYELKYEEQSTENSIKNTMKNLFKPLLLTTITTVIGIASLVSTGIKPIIQMGIMASVGVIIIFILSLTFMPAFLRMSKSKARSFLKEDGENKFLRKFTEIVLDKKYIFIIILSIAAVLFIYNIPKLRASMDMSIYLPKTSNSIKGGDFINKHFGSSSFLTVYFDGSDHKDFYYVRTMKDIQAFFEEQTETSHTAGYTDLITQYFERMRNSEYIPANNSLYNAIFLFLKPEYYQDVLIPDSSESLLNVYLKENDVAKIEEMNQKLQALINSKVTLEYSIEDLSEKNMEYYSNYLISFLNFREIKFESKLIDDMKGFALKEEKNFEDIKNNISIYFEDISENHLNDFVSLAFDQYVAVPGNDKNLEIFTTGSPIITGAINDLIVNSQIRSLSIALSLITITFMIIMKSFVFGILAIIPLAMTLLFNFGFIYFAGFELNAASITIGSIMIGLAIDYIIHYLSRFTEEYNHKNRREAIIKASATTGNAILSAGLTTFAGFFPLSFSRVGIISQFGAISAFNVAAAIVLTLIIFPLILNWVPDKFINK